MPLDSMPSASAAGHAVANGGTTHDEDDVVLVALRKQIAQRQVRYDELRDQLDALGPELKRMQRALELLTGEAHPPGQAATTTQRKRRRPYPQRTAAVADQRLEDVKAAILDYAQDHEEFRQVDIRAHMNDSVNSGPMAIAFEKLRQDHVIRLARQEGNGKWYRLTRETRRAADAQTAAS